MNKKPRSSSKSLVKREFTTLARVSGEFTPEQKEFVLKTIAPSLNDNELLLFLYRSQKLGLNPLEGEIFAYTSFETINGQQVRKMVMIVARDGKRKIAFRTGHLKSINTEAIYIRKDAEKTIKVQPWEGGELWGATCTIFRDDFEKPFVVSVPLAEYNRGNFIWKNKPETMIKKVAESQCLSEALPELAGVYDEAERFDSVTPAPLAALPDGGSPATESQVATIKALGGVLPDDEQITKEEARQMLIRLKDKKK